MKLAELELKFEENRDNNKSKVKTNFQTIELMSKYNKLLNADDKLEQVRLIILLKEL